MHRFLAGLISAVIMFSTLPPSFLSSGLGRTTEENMVASGVCSILTVISLVIFCVVSVLSAYVKKWNCGLKYL